MAHIVTTSFLLSNLHCPSCVSHIQDTLFSLEPQPISVSPSLLSSSVTVKHTEALPVTSLRKALEQAGFDISDGTTDSKTPEAKSHVADKDVGYLDRFISRLQSNEDVSAKSKYPAQHLENCEACRLASTEHKPKDTDSALHDGTRKKMEKDLVVVDSTSPKTYRASLAIGGMTCSACVGTITEELEKKPWIEKVVINLISNSATVDFVGVDHKNDIVESIEDIGYDANIDTVVQTGGEEPSILSTSRTVDILVQGMFCQNCPGRVLGALESFGDQVRIDKTLNANDPVARITYTPKVPSFTIRNIIAAISDADPALQPSIYHPPSLEERSRQIHHREQLRILIRVFFTLLIAIPTFIIGIVFMSLVSSHNAGRMFLMQPLRAGVSRAQWALFIMATPVYFLCADLFHIRALKEIRSMWRRGSTTPLLQRFYRFGSMNMLMSLGTTIAYISSVAQLIAAGVHPPAETNNNTFYFDSVVFLTLFLLVGRLIESYSKTKTGDAVTKLGELRPTEALLVVANVTDTDSIDETTAEKQNTSSSKHEVLRTIPVDHLEFGDIVKLRQGGSPPCDGIVVQGETKFDESSLTGESKLTKKTLGDEVFSGTVNKDSPISIKITGVAGSSMLDQIVKAVREGQTRRAPIQRVADTLTAYFTPMVTLIAIVTWIIWLSLGLSGRLPKDWLDTESGGWVAWSLQFAIAVFVVACPCGLGLAAPTALFVGGGLAAQHGILVKGGGEAFEKASKLDCIVFDKTGTLTAGGEPVVTDHQVFPLKSENKHDEVCSVADILAMVKAIEDNSSHTIAKALSSFCKNSSITDMEVSSPEEIAGKGLKGSFHSTNSNEPTEMLIGNELLLSESKILVGGDAQSTLDDWKSQGKSVALAAIKSNQTWQLAVIFAISDPIRPEAPFIIKGLQERGTDVWMLSGDNQITANAIGTQIGIPASNIIAGVLPNQKAEKIQYLQKSLKTRTSSGTDHNEKRALIAMVGDGINDSPALTTADVGIAIGSGSDIAISSAEFVLVSSSLTSLITLLDLSKTVFRRIKFNFAWALVYNLVALPVAAGVLFPVVSDGKHVRLDPVWASLAMAASSISVVLSSLALRSRVPGVGFRIRKRQGGGLE
ncbi:putative copper-transporting ATPase 3 [Tricladium varicosporioides]|nr:putative copper-transporting ATPase 3 [Hymenoscyphus varicosporioides]